MATRKRATRTKADDELEAELEAELIDDDGSQTVEAKLAEFFGRGSDKDGVTVSIYEVDPSATTASKLGFLYSFELTQQPRSADLMAQLLEDFGPGLYEAVATREDGKFVARERFALGSARARARAALRGPGRAVDDEPAPAARPDAGGGASSELRLILEQQTRLIEAIANRPQPEPVNIIEVAQQLSTIKTLFHDDAPPAPTQSAFEMFKDFMQLRELISDDAPASDPLSSVAKHLAPVLAKAVERLDEQQQAKVRAFVDRMARENGAADPSQPEAAAEGATMYQAELSKLVKQAEAKTPAEQAAAALVQRLSVFPAAVRDQVLDFLNDTEVVATLSTIDSRVQQHGPWFEQVVDLVLTAFAPPGDDSGDVTEPPAQPKAAAGSNGGHELPQGQ